MKFLKKTAALLFCVALALSVMAVSAMAADEITDDTNLGFSVELKEVTAHSDVNTVNGNEYKTSGDALAYNVVLTSTQEVKVNAFEFSVGIDATGGAGLAISSVAAAGDNAGDVEVYNENGKYVFAIQDSTKDYTINKNGTTIATIALTLTGNSKQYATVSLSGVLAKARVQKERQEVTSTAATATVEVDPEYSITVKNPDVDSTTLAIKGGYSDPDSYTAVEGSDKYTILTGGSVTEPTLAHYEFSKYLVDSTSTGNWAENGKPTEYTTSTLNDTLLKNSSGGMYGDLVLKAVYTPKEYKATVVIPTESTVNGTLTFTDTNYMAYASGQATTSSDVSYTIEGLASAILAPTDKTAYTFVKYAYTNTTGEGKVAGGNWADIEAMSLTSAWAIPEGHYGDVTLTAMFTPIEYTVSYKLEPNATMTISAGNTKTDADATPYTQTYTINDTINGTFAFVYPVARPGYSFDGWTAATTGNSAKTIGNVGSDSAAWPSAATGTVDTTGKYGDVTLTAHWTIIGKFASVSYNYARSDEKLILFAVETPATGGAYTCNGNEMFQVAKKYESAFSETVTNYTIYGYIASSATTVSDIKFEASKSNGTIAYGGDMTGNNSVDAGDYGNVIAMLADNDQYTNEQLGVKARLEADMGVGSGEQNDTTTMLDEVTRNFASIVDVRLIMDKALNKTVAAVEMSGSSAPSGD